MREFLWSALAALAFAAPLAAAEPPAVRIVHYSVIPSPVPGYEVNACVKNRIRIFHPHGWVVKSRTVQDIFQCYATADGSSEFAGLEMAVFTVPQSADAERPKERMEKSIANLRNVATEFEVSTSEDDSFSYYNVRIAIGNNRGILVWATDKSNDAVVHLILTASKEKWPEVERLGGTMLRNIAVDTRPWR